MEEKQNIIQKIQGLILLSDQEKGELISQLDRLSPELLMELKTVLNSEMKMLSEAIRTVQKRQPKDMETFLNELVALVKTTNKAVLREEEAEESTEAEEKSEEILKEL